MSTSSSAASIKVRSRGGDEGGGVEAVVDQRPPPMTTFDGDEEDIFSGALPKVDSADFAPEVKVKKKRTGVFRKVGHALFGKRKKKDKTAGTAETSVTPTPAASSPTLRLDYSNFFREPEQWPEDLAAGGRVFSTLSPSEEPTPHITATTKPASALPTLRAAQIAQQSFSPDHSTGTPMFIGDETPSNRLDPSTFPSQEESFFPPPTFNRKDTESGNSGPNSSQFEKPIIHLDQPAVVRPEPRQPARWFGGDSSSKKGPSKVEIKKREKRIAYLRQAQYDLEEASQFGLDSMAEPMRTLEDVEKEERRKFRALLRETREGFEEFLNEFCKAVYARHGLYCIWRLSVLKSKYSANVDLAGILKDVRKEELALYSNAIEIFNDLAVRKTTRKIDWQMLCAQDAAMLTKILVVKSQCSYLIRKYFSDEADILTLNPPHILDTPPKLGASETGWLAERDLNVNAFAEYTSEKTEAMNVVERSEYLLRNVCDNGARAAQEEQRRLKDDLQRLDQFIGTLLDQNFDKKATHPPEVVNNVLSVYEARFPAASSNRDINTIIRRVLADCSTRQFGAGFCVESEVWDRQDIFHLNKWCTEAAYWQAYDIKMSQKLYKDQIELADLRESKRKYLRQSLVEKLAALWVSNTIKIQRNSMEELVDSLESTCKLGSPTVSSGAFRDERRMMDMEDSLGKMQSAWYAQYRDVKAKANVFKIPLKSIDHVSQMSEMLLELLDALKRDSSLLKDLELQTALDALQREVDGIESKKKSLKTKHAAQDQSLTKSIDQCMKKKEELMKELHEEEEKADNLDALKVQYDQLVAEVDELKENLDSLKTAIKIKKAEKHSPSRNAKLANEVKSLMKDVSKNTAILKTYSASEEHTPPIRTPSRIEVTSPRVPEVIIASPIEGGDYTPPTPDPPAVPSNEHSAPSTKRKSKLGLFGKVVKVGKGSSSKDRKTDEERRSTSDGEIALLADEDEEEVEEEASHATHLHKTSSLLQVKSSPHRHRSRSVAVLHPSAILEALGLQERKKPPTIIENDANVVPITNQESEDKMSKTTLAQVNEAESLEVIMKRLPSAESAAISLTPLTPAQNRSKPFGVLADVADELEAARSQESVPSSPPYSKEDFDRSTSVVNMSPETADGGTPGLDSLTLTESDGTSLIDHGVTNTSESHTSFDLRIQSDSSPPTDLGVPKISQSPAESDQLPISFSLESHPLVRLADVPPLPVAPQIRRSWSNHSVGNEPRVPTVAIIPSSPQSTRRFDQQARSDDDQGSSVSLSVSAVSEFDGKKKRTLWKKLLRRRH